MQESKKEMLLKGVCCLMLLQINGEAKGNTQLRPAQKDTTYLVKGLSLGPSSPYMPKTTFPIKSESEIVVPATDKSKGARMQSFPAQRMKKGNKAFHTPFIQRKMNMRSVGTGKKSSGKVGTVNTWKQSAPAFQWTRVSTQRGGKALLNRSVANRICHEC